jgi:hypothetical protein
MGDRQRSPLGCAMTRDEILKLVGQPGTPIELECVAARYFFDFSCRPCIVGDQVLFELGRHDANVPIVIDMSNGYIYFLHENRLSFINSSFALLLRAFEIVNRWDIPNDLSDAERACVFQTQMLDNDRESFRDPEGFWSTMREEIEYGVI